MFRVSPFLINMQKSLESQCCVCFTLSLYFIKFDRKCYVPMRSLKIQTSYSMTKYVCKNDIDISPKLSLEFALFIRRITFHEKYLNIAGFFFIV